MRVTSSFQRKSYHERSVEFSSLMQRQNPTSLPVAARFLLRTSNFLPSRRMRSPVSTHQMGAISSMVAPSVRLVLLA
nr:MAG TPA: hypothetical protein [Caudoviricetes sp.]